MSYLNQFEQKIFSQNGEDGILQELVRLLNPPPFFVEFGVQTGVECNTRKLKHSGWCGICWDSDYSDPDRNIYRERVTAENINDLFSKCHVPESFGVLSVDIDGNDYHVWSSLSTNYRPAIVVIEYNASIPPDQSRTVLYSPDFRWDETNYYGASFLALQRLGVRKGYKLVCADARGVNLFFVREDLLPTLPSEVVSEPISSLYKPPGYGPGNTGHTVDPQRRPWLEVEP